MLTIRKLLAVAICTLLIGCGRVSPAEAKLFGTWDTHTVDATESLTFHRDHTFSTAGELGGHHFAVASGTWRLDGNQVNRTFTSAAGDQKLVGLELRDSVSQLTDDKWVVEGGNIYTRRR